MHQDPDDPIAERLAVAVWMTGAVAALGFTGLLLSALGAPDTLTWPLATGAAVAGGLLASRHFHRRRQRR